MATRSSAGLLRGFSLPSLPGGQRVKPWMVVALALAIFIGVYYAFLGMRYWRASERITALELEVAALERAVSGGKPAVPPSMDSQEAPQARLDRLNAEFSLAKSDDALALVSSLAQRAGVVVVTAAMGEPQSKAVEGVRYAVQPVSLTLMGDVDQLYAYLDGLAAARRPLAVQSFRLANLDGQPTALVQVELYYEPKAAETDGKTATQEKR